MTEKIIRFGVSIEPELLNKFDKTIKKKSYTNRSEAIRDLIRKYIIVEESQETDAEGLGTLTILYDHHVSALKNRLIDIQHDHHQEILTTTHIHIDHNNCLEVLVIRGKTKEIKKLADAIKALKGIKHGELVITRASV